jgi:hypothetical protein
VYLPLKFNITTGKRAPAAPLNSPRRFERTKLENPSVKNSGPPKMQQEGALRNWSQIFPENAKF